VAAENMPFVCEGPNAGMIPDVILGPASINSRMTINMLREGAASLSGLMSGTEVDATAYRDLDTEGLLRVLTDRGLALKVQMADGVTRVPFDEPCFLMSVWIARLHHMAEDKVSVRQRGPKAAVTRQPTAGRANNGGQRLGGMETDALLAEGVAYVIDDRLRVASDAKTVPICSHCGQAGELRHDTLPTLLAQARAHGGSLDDVPVDVAPCRMCGRAGGIVMQPSNWCFEGLVVREFAAMGVQVVHGFKGGAAGGQQRTPSARTLRHGLEDSLEDGMEADSDGEGDGRGGEGRGGDCTRGGDGEGRGRGGGQGNGMGNDGGGVGAPTASGPRGGDDKGRAAAAAAAMPPPPPRPPRARRAREAGADGEPLPKRVRHA
jgi:hypothetical protein